MKDNQNHCSCLVNLFKSLKNFEINLYLSLCFFDLIPSIYQTIRTFIISSTIDTEQYNIIGQMSWFSVISETIQAFLIVPLYSVFNNILEKGDSNFFSEFVFKSILPSILIYLIFSISIYFYGSYLIKFMNPEEIDINLVIEYLKLETVAEAINIINYFVKVIFVVLEKAKNIYFFLLAKFVITIISDFFIIPRYGVKGVGVSNMLINLITALINIIILLIEKHIKFGCYNKNDLVHIKLWLKTGFFSVIQQFCDNFTYIFVICRFVNLLSEQGNYWLVNNFIWGYLLIPTQNLAEIIKVDCKKKYENLNQKRYYLISLIIFIIWGVTIPLWQPFFKFAEKLENFKEIFYICLKLLPFYIVYGLSVIPDSIFIGLGNTKYNLIISLLINIIYYGIFWIVYKINSFEMTMNIVILIFGFGMVIHAIISLILEKIFLQKELKNSDFNKVKNTEEEQLQDNENVILSENDNKINNCSEVKQQ